MHFSRTLWTKVQLESEEMVATFWYQIRVPFKKIGNMTITGEKLDPNTPEKEVGHYLTQKSI